MNITYTLNNLTTITFSVKLHKLSKSLGLLFKYVTAFMECDWTLPFLNASSLRDIPTRRCD
jgi:hypothetical protein